MGSRSVLAPPSCCPARSTLPRPPLCSRGLHRCLYTLRLLPPRRCAGCRAVPRRVGRPGCSSQCRMVLTVGGAVGVSGLRCAECSTTWKLYIAVEASHVLSSWQGW